MRRVDIFPPPPLCLFFILIRLKKESINYLNDLSIEFRQNTKNHLSKTIQRAMKENFYLNNQIESLTNHLEKTIELNKKSAEEKTELSKTISILEDVQHETTEKHLKTENVS